MSEEDIKKQLEELKQEQERLKTIIEEPLKFSKRTSISATGEFKELIREKNTKGLSEEKFLKTQILKLEQIKNILSSDKPSDEIVDHIKKIILD